MKFSPTAVCDHLMTDGDDGDDDNDDHGDNQLIPDIDHNPSVIYSSPEANDDSNNIISSNSPPMKENAIPFNDSPAIDNSPTIDNTSIKPDING